MIEKMKWRARIVSMHWNLTTFDNTNVFIVKCDHLKQETGIHNSDMLFIVFSVLWRDIIFCRYQLTLYPFIIKRFFWVVDQNEKLSRYGYQDVAAHQVEKCEFIILLMQIKAFRIVVIRAKKIGLFQTMRKLGGK